MRYSMYNKVGKAGEGIHFLDKSREYENQNVIN